MKSFYLLKSYFKERFWLIVLGVISLILVDFLQLAIPRVIKWAVDEISLLETSQVHLFKYAGYIVIIACFMGFFRYIWRRCLLGTSRRVEEGLRNRLFEHLQGLRPEYFDRTRTGDLMAHATNDLQQIRMATGMGLVAINDAIFLGIAALGFMAYINLQLTLYVILPMPFIVLGTRYFTKKLHQRYLNVQAKFAEMTESVRERFAGIRMTQAYGLEYYSALKTDGFSREYVQSNLDLVKITGLFFPMMLFLTNISMAAVIYFGGRKTVLADISPGDFAAFISYLNLLTWPMMAMGWVINLLQRGRASLDRIDHILRVPGEVGQKCEVKKKEKPDFKPGLCFERVSFAYPDTGLILEDISFELKPGESLGIVGPPGSGKTSLLQLIPRLYNTKRGRIIFSGQDIQCFPLSYLRSNISFVPQEPFLFSGSIEENILLGQAGDYKDKLYQVLETAELLETIQGFEAGLKTLVGEKGVILSGGQRQRVSLARALLSPAKVLVLDDPISQVDAPTGSRIIKNLFLKEQRENLILASHRLSAVSGCDKILVLKQGKVAEMGSHPELMQASDYYASTYKMQNLKEEISSYTESPIGDHPEEA